MGATVSMMGANAAPRLFFNWVSADIIEDMAAFVPPEN